MVTRLNGATSTGSGSAAYTMRVHHSAPAAAAPSAATSSAAGEKALVEVRDGRVVYHPGVDEEILAPRGVTAAAGFRYTWDEPTQQFAHPSGIVVATPDGRLSRYLFGLEFGPRDLRLALIEASEGKIGGVIDSVLLYCYHYDPMKGRYGFVIMQALRLAGAATVLLIGGFIVVMLRRERSH